MRYLLVVTGGFLAYVAGAAAYIFSYVIMTGQYIVVEPNMAVLWTEFIGSIMLVSIGITCAIYATRR